MTSVDTSNTPESIDQYIAQFEPEIQERLNAMRATIHENAPDATEKIAYQMPTFVLFGNLVHFAAFKHHIGFYPAPSGVSEYAQELARYKTAKGSIQFPLDEPLPLGLVAEVVRFRVAENTAKHDLKKNR